jgi:hypothetical protein
MSALAWRYLKFCVQLLMTPSVRLARFPDLPHFIVCLRCIGAASRKLESPRVFRLGGNSLDYGRPAADFVPFRRPIRAEKAISICKPGVGYNEIGGVIEDHVMKLGLTTTRNFCGHGVGSVFHTNPTILHYKNKQNNGIMAPGHIFTIEPMINEGDHKNIMWKDGWTATTADGGRTAQFEHTLLITEDGVEALTGKTENSPRYWWETD